MSVTLVTPLLRIVSSSSSSSSSFILQRLQKFVVYVWIVVITLHNISIVSNSALNPSLIITTATSTTTITTNNNNNNHYNHPYNSKKNMFRTVLSSHTGDVSSSTSDTTLQLQALHPVSLTTRSSSFHEHPPPPPPLSSIRTSTSGEEEEEEPEASVTTPSKRRTSNTKQLSLLRSPLKTRFGLFRRKLMMVMDDDNDDENTASSFLYNTNTNNNTNGSRNQTNVLSSSTAILAATTTSHVAFMNSNNNLNKLSTSSYVRGGSTTTITTATNSMGESGKQYLSKLFMILSKLFHTVLVQNFCHFANFVGTTKTRCLCLLVFSVFIESYATTLSKQAKDTGNALLFARACLVYIFCMVGFNISLAKLDVSVAYAVWSALGTTLVTAVGFFWFGESLDATKILYLGMIVSGVVGLNLHSSEQ